jgi:CsoR family transcriptional regulator, copper-sensing transcriptional repressor
MNETMQHETTHRMPVSTAAKPDILRRLAYIEGHVQGVRRMVDEDKYCVDVLKQTYAVRRAIEKLEAMILENHLQGCVVEGIKEGREDAVIGELLDLYELAGR